MAKQSFVLDSVKRALANGQNIHLTIEGGGQLIVMGKDALFRQNGCQLNNLIRSDKKNTRISLLSDDSQSVQNSRDKGREISELLWMLGYQLSGGELLEGCTSTDVFQLARWPNFTRLPHNQNCMRIAALTSGRATSTEMVHRILKIPQEDAYRFYSAACTAGYVQLVGREADEITLKPHRHESIIGSLLAKLRRA